MTSHKYRSNDKTLVISDPDIRLTFGRLWGVRGGFMVIPLHLLSYLTSYLPSFFKGLYMCCLFFFFSHPYFGPHGWRSKCLVSLIQKSPGVSTTPCVKPTVCVLCITLIGAVRNIVELFWFGSFAFRQIWFVFKAHIKRLILTVCTTSRKH